MGRKTRSSTSIPGKLHEVNRFISLSGHKWECSPVLASRIAWGRLNEDDRKLITEVAREATDTTSAG